MRGQLRSIAAFGALCVAGGLATAANATDLAPASASTRLRIEVAGVISPRCTVGQSESSASFGQLLDPSTGGTAARSLTLDFTFDCNSPFRAVMTSQNGGMQTDVAPAPGFRNRITYDAALALPNGQASRACDSEQMQREAGERAGCVFRFNGRAGASGAASVKLSMAPDPTPVLAGQYRDRLVLRLSPILGGERD
jgi:hypothetical protein